MRPERKAEMISRSSAAAAITSSSLMPTVMSHAAVREDALSPAARAEGEGINGHSLPVSPIDYSRDRDKSNLNVLSSQVISDLLAFPTIRILNRSPVVRMKWTPKNLPHLRTGCPCLRPWSCPRSTGSGRRRCLPCARGRRRRRRRGG